MLIDRFRDDVSEWVRGWVSQHSDVLGHAPCPFAAPALADGRIAWEVCRSAAELSSLLRSLDSMLPGRDVLVIGLDPGSVTPRELSEATMHANAESLMPNGLVALEDHPDDEEIVAGVVMNQGAWAMVLVQELGKLTRASDRLRAIGYYDGWSPEELDSVVTWRVSRSPDP